jgi:hypothetical protein
MATATKSEILICKRAIVVLTEIQKKALSVIDESKSPPGFKDDLLTLIKVIRRLEDEATQ